MTRSPDAEQRCDAAGIVLNKNAIPFDPQPASIASGIRVGSPAVTTQGMVESDMKAIASLIGTAIRDADGSRTAEVAAGVRELVGAHPAYPEPVSAPAERMREYAVVLLTAALVTFLATPVVRMAAIRFRMMAAPRERDVHVIPTPRGGGVAISPGSPSFLPVCSSSVRQRPEIWSSRPSGNPPSRM